MAAVSIARLIALVLLATLVALAVVVLGFIGGGALTLWLVTLVPVGH